LELVCECAKGTYIRVLGEDIARALGTCGHLTQLRRAWVEPFRDLPMFALEAVLAGAQDVSGMLAPETALRGLPEAWVTAEQVVALRHGQAVRSEIKGPAPGRRVCLYGPGGVFLGLAEPLPEGWLQPRRLLQAPEAKPML
jgi:tRNA pseudouridine55 synthase